jgi:hypothetical protein
MAAEQLDAMAKAARTGASRRMLTGLYRHSRVTEEDAHYGPTAH